MERQRDGELLLAILLALGLLGAVARDRRAASVGSPPHAPELLPDLACDGAERLALLPGVGPERAREIVAARPFLGAPLTPDNLALLPGVGATTARTLADLYAARARPMPADPPR